MVLCGHYQRRPCNSCSQLISHLIIWRDELEVNGAAAAAMEAPPYRRSRALAAAALLLLVVILLVLPQLLCFFLPAALLAVLTVASSSGFLGDGASLAERLLSFAFAADVAGGGEAVDGGESAAFYDAVGDQQLADSPSPAGSATPAVHTRSPSERDWRSTLAGKIYDEKMMALKACAGGEAMDALWEAYETSSNTADKRSNGETAAAKSNAAGEEEEDDAAVDREPCCLQALKLSAAAAKTKVSLGGVGRRNLSKISKILRRMSSFQNRSTFNWGKKKSVTKSRG